MLDGVVEAHTAAMLAPYTDDPTQSGKLFWIRTNTKATIADLDARGLRFSRTPSETKPCDSPSTPIRTPPQ